MNDRRARPAIDVVVPSYGRPDELRRCLRALAAQTVAPARVIVVVRTGDTATGDAVAAASSADPRVTRAVVDEPGVIAALTAGVAATSSPVVAITDDDAMPRPDWIERLADAFTETTVSAVGGRDVIPGEEGPLTETVGRFTRTGRLTGNHHLGTGPARDVHVLKGVNMAVRAGRLALPAAGVLRGSGAQVDFEVLVCAWVRQRGGRIVYDPAILVDHHPAPRTAGDARHRPPDADVRDAAYNAVVAATLLRRREMPRQLAFGLAIGTHDRPGAVRALVAVVRHEHGVVPRLLPAAAGRLAGAWFVLRAGRGQRHLVAPRHDRRHDPRHDPGLR